MLHSQCDSHYDNSYSIKKNFLLIISQNICGLGNKSVNLQKQTKNIMRSSTQNTSNISADMYAKPLLKLNEGLRIEIMHILLNSINKDESTKKEQHDLYSCFKGSWGDGVNADEYCEELREGIYEPKEIATW